VLRAVARSLPRRTSPRRERARDGVFFDLRQTTRAAMRTGGVPIRRAWQRRGETARRVVFLLDVSGSMWLYARPLLVLCAAAVRASNLVEAFTFGTRLTRLTPSLRAGADPDEALERTVRALSDRAGGTRIGESLRVFNRGWARRGMTRAAVVVIVSDGWECGDVGVLADELEILGRMSHRILWVNPLAGDPDYEPLAAGMAAALGHVDALLPGQSLRDIEALAAALAAQ